MNYKMIGYIIGRILMVEAALMSLALIVSLLYGEAATGAFAITIGAE